MNSPQNTEPDTVATLRLRRERDSNIGREVLRALADQAKALGFAEFEPPSWDDAQFQLERDPSDGNLGLVARWYHTHGQRLGEVIIREDGHCYAECDILQPHPGNRRWFVECVAVWGSSGNLKGDPRLLPAL